MAGSAIPRTDQASSSVSANSMSATLYGHRYGLEELPTASSLFQSQSDWEQQGGAHRSPGAHGAHGASSPSGKAAAAHVSSAVDRLAAARERDYRIGR